jgi:hypothetical protein
MIRDAIQISAEIKELDQNPLEPFWRRRNVHPKNIINSDDIKLLQELATSFTEQRSPDAGSPLLVVDQLWIWTFEGHTLLIHTALYISNFVLRLCNYEFSAQDSAKQ